MNCTSCSHRNRLDENTIECRRFPPQVTILLVQQRTIMGDQIGPQSFAGFPLVQADQWCGEFASAGQDRKGSGLVLAS